MYELSDHAVKVLFPSKLLDQDKVIFLKLVKSSIFLDEQRVSAAYLHHKGAKFCFTL